MRATIVARARAVARLRAAGFGTYSPATRSAGIVPEHPNAQVSAAGGTSEAVNAPGAAQDLGLFRYADRQVEAALDLPADLLSVDSGPTENWPAERFPRAMAVQM